MEKIDWDAFDKTEMEQLEYEKYMIVEVEMITILGN